MALDSAVTGAILKALTGISIKVYDEIPSFKFDDQLKQLFFNATKEYFQTYSDRHGQIQVLGMSKPMSLDTIYSDTRMVDIESMKSYDSREALEGIYRNRGERRLRVFDCPKINSIEIANEYRRLVILGDPGIGKSTFLRKVGLEALKGMQGDYIHELLPVFIELKRFKSPEQDLKVSIAAEFKNCGFPNAEEFTEKALRRGLLLLLFDGLDEVPNSNLNTIILSIQNLVDRYSKNPFIVSCRTAAYHTYFKRVSTFAISEFDDDQIEQFIYNWFSSNLDLKNQNAEECWEKLQQSENKGAKELAQSPLLLTFLCLVYNKSLTVPKNHITLYGKALDIMLEEWASEKRVRRGEIYEGFHSDLEKELLAKIAYEGLENNQLFFTKSHLMKSISEFLGDLLDAPKSLNASEVLQAIEDQQGILVERAIDVYSFSHLTFQEYLASKHIVKWNLFDDLIEFHLFDNRWNSIFLLVFSLLSHSSIKVFQRILEIASNIIDEPKLKLILSDLDILITSELKAYPISHARAYILNDLLVNNFPILQRFINSHKIDISNPIETKKYKFKHLIKTLSDVENDNLKQYIYANLLVIESSEVIFGLSRKIWADIESQIFLIDESKASENSTYIIQTFFDVLGANYLITNNGSFLVSQISNEFQYYKNIFTISSNNQSLNSIIEANYDEISKSTNNSELVIIIYNTVPSSMDRLRVAEEKINNDITIIPIPLIELEHSIQEKLKCKTLLREYINRYTQRSNFFDDRNAISDSLNFFGRTKLLDQLKEEVLRNQCIGLFGTRKSGKTSVLIQLRYHLQKYNYPVIFLDMQRFEKGNYKKELFADIIGQLLTVQGQKSSYSDILSILEDNNTSSNIQNNFINYFNELVSSLKQFKYKLPVIFMIDEIECVFPLFEDNAEIVDEFNSCFGVLRSLSQYENTVSFIIADVHPDCNRINSWIQSSGRSNPLYSYLKEIYLSPFEEQDTTQMLDIICRFMGLQIHTTLSQKIHIESGGHPFISRQIARYLYQNKYINIEEVSSNKLTDNDWNNLLFDFFELSNHFEKSLWEVLEMRGDHYSIEILKTLASNYESMPWLSKDDIQSNLSIELSESEYQKSQSWLISVGIISEEVKSGNRLYQIHIHHLYRWICLKMSKDELNNWKILQ